MKRAIAILLVALILTGALSGCRKKKLPCEESIKPQEAESTSINNIKTPKAISLMGDIRPQDVKDKNVDYRFINSAAEFSFEIFKKAVIKNGNTLISPVSIINCIALVENGTEGKTLNEIQRKFNLNRNDMNAYLKAFNNKLAENGSVTLANSLWTDSSRITLNKEFLQTNANYLGADVFSVDFNNHKAYKEINSWVKEQTNGMIKEIVVNEDNRNSLLYLVNAMTFEELWRTPYQNYSLERGTFTSYDGKKQSAKFMNSREYGHIKLDNAEGFIKDYANGNYSFAALLPNKGIDVFDFVNSLSGKDFVNAVKNPEKNIVLLTKLPEFECEYSKNLRDSLINIGIKRAFDSNTKDFEPTGKIVTRDNIYLSSVIHKTYIEVTPNGTKAGSAAISEEKAGAAADMQYIEIYLDRPFVYAIIDNETGLPIFLGLLLGV